MPIYRFSRPQNGGAAFAAVAGQSNWVLESVTSCGTVVSRLVEAGWGGEDTVNTAMRTRISYNSTVGAGVRNLLDVAVEGTTSTVFSDYVATTYGTAQPSITAGSLLCKAWNSNGGLFHWQAQPGGGFVLVGSQSLECRADIGAGNGTYDGAWSERG